MAGKSMAAQTVLCLEVVEQIMNAYTTANEQEQRMLMRDFGRITQETLKMAERRMERSAYEALRQEATEWLSIYAVPAPRAVQ